MKIKHKLFYLGIVILVSGCMSPYVPLALPSSHPASNEGKEAQMYHASSTLEVQKNSESIKENKKEDGSSQPHDMKSMKDMGGMNHASH